MTSNLQFFCSPITYVLCNLYNLGQGLYLSKVLRLMSIIQIQLQKKFPTLKILKVVPWLRNAQQITNHIFNFFLFWVWLYKESNLLLKS